MAFINKTIINIYVSPDLMELVEQFEKLNLKTDNIMATIAQLTEKVDNLQVALDAEQEQIREAIENLNAAIASLEAMLADGGTPEQRQELADKLDTIKSDLESTVSDEEPEA